MRKNAILFIGLFFLVLYTYPGFLSGLNNPIEEIQFGDQIWMSRNLDVTHFRNGDEIPHALTNNEWRRAAERGEPAWCYYDNDSKNGAVYGRLYNWYAITDPRGIGPEGWRVPDNDDWKKLEVSLGMSKQEVEKQEWRGAGQGNKLRQQGTNLWRAPNAGANNQSGFTALPGGYRQPGGVFETMGFYGSWWTVTAFNDQLAYYRDLSSMNSGVYKGAYPKGCGFSVRLVREPDSVFQSLSDLTDDRDGNVYKVVRIGNQVWMAENLRYLPEVHNNDEFRQAGIDTEPGFGVSGYDGSAIETAKSQESYQKYGVLYNWWAATGGSKYVDSEAGSLRRICPAGWYLPSDSEWTELSNYLSGENVAGNKMKSTSGWNDGGNGTNSSGFNGLPGGMRDAEGRSDRVGSFGYWWSSTEHTPRQSYTQLLDQGDALKDSRAWARRLSSREGELSRNHSSKVPGRSVRCVTKVGSFHGIHRHQRVDIEPDDERDTALVPSLETPVRFVVVKPDSIIIPDSVFVMELPAQEIGPEGHPPGPSQEIRPGQQVGETDSIIIPDSVFVIELPAQEISPEGHPPGPSQDIGQGQVLKPDTVTEDPHHGQVLQKIKDVEDNEYNIVIIGNQIWMTENLRVSRFRNGDPIANIISGNDWDAWKREGSPAFSYYDNDPAFDKEFGKLYNWWTVNDSRGICPVGWRVPSETDWRTLVSYLGDDVAANKLKSTNGWRINGFGENGNNQSGFNGKPGGHRYASGFLGFKDMHSNGNWWASNRDYLGSAWRFRLSSLGGRYDLGSYSPANAYSVRCIKE